MIVNEFIITIGFGGRGARSIRGRVLFCSNNAAVRGLIGARGLIEEIRYLNSNSLLYFRGSGSNLNLGVIKKN